MTPDFRAARPLAAAIVLCLAACGGSSDPAPTAGDGGGPTMQITAEAGSAETAVVSWPAAAGGARWSIERQAAGGAWQALATVDAAAGRYLDRGLAPQTAYRWRLVDAGRTLGSGEATTGAEPALATAPATPAGAGWSQTLGAAAARLASDGGEIAVDVPAGALPAGTAARLQPAAGTLPGALGTAYVLELGARPTKPLALTLRWDAADDDQADAQRVAVQGDDGRWTVLPLQNADPATRTLTATLPWELIDARVTLVRYVAFTLKPAQARVKVKNSLSLLPVAHVKLLKNDTSGCTDPLQYCVPTPVIKDAEIPFLNALAGYDRQWLVNGEPGGGTGWGTVVPKAEAGATYTAPDTVPQPPTAKVAFVSRHRASGRQLKLVSKIEIWDDTWSGQFVALSGPSDAGTTLTVTAPVRWQLDAGASSGGVKVYRAIGQLEVAMADPDCTVLRVDPATHPVTTDPFFVELRVDETTVPMTYHARLVTFWKGTIQATCKGISSSMPTDTAGYGWDVKGSVNIDGRTIEGGTTDTSGNRIEWSFTR